MACAGCFVTWHEAKIRLVACYFDLGQKYAASMQKTVVFLCCVRKQPYLCIVKTKQ